MSIILDGTTGITTPGLTNTGTETLVNLTTTGNTILGDASTDTLNVGNGGLIKDASGNVGVGVTPSAWSGSSKAIQIQRGTLNSYANLDLQLGQNYYYDGTNNKYVASSYATYYSQYNGSHIWTTAPSGTAGNAITFTQAMTLDASGNLGVGATSPAATFGSNVLQMYGSAATELRFTSGNSGTTSTDGLSIGIDSSSIAYFYNRENTAIVFGTNNTERARIDSSGNLLVGTTGLPTANGKISSASASTSVTPGRFYCSAGDSYPSLSFDKSSTTNTTSQIFAIFTINNQATGSGQINANGASQAAFGSFSDARLKENIVDLPPQLSNIMALRPVEFDYIESEGGGHQISFIAQEFEQVYPDAVGERADGMKTLTGWSKTEARLVKAIQEQQSIIQSLTDRISVLEQK